MFLEIAQRNESDNILVVPCQMPTPNSEYASKFSNLQGHLTLVTSRDVDKEPLRTTWKQTQSPLHQKKIHARSKSYTRQTSRLSCRVLAVQCMAIEKLSKKSRTERYSKSLSYSAQEAAASNPRVSAQQQRCVPQV